MWTGPALLPRPTASVIPRVENTAIVARTLTKSARRVRIARTIENTVFFSWGLCGMSLHGASDVRLISRFGGSLAFLGV